jgi:hypothetical protein
VGFTRNGMFGLLLLLTLVGRYLFVLPTCKGARGDLKLGTHAHVIIHASAKLVKMIGRVNFQGNLKLFLARLFSTSENIQSRHSIMMVDIVNLPDNSLI